MTRIGKIARLPKNIREELNQRLQDGQFGAGLLNWLNNLLECEEMLADHFDSQPISKQNLSEWKQGGYQDWLRNEEARQQVQRLAENAEDLENEAGAMSIADRIGTVLSMQLLAMIEQLDSIADSEERWARLREILRELHHLRREDHRARRLRMAEEQWKVKCDREAAQQKKAEAKRLLKLQGAMESKLMLAKLKGRGKEAWKWTDWEIRVHHGLQMPRWWRNPQTMEEWSELMMPYWKEQVKERREDAAARSAKDGAGAEKKENGGSKMEDGKSSVEVDAGTTDSLDDQIEDGESREIEDRDKRDACPTSDSVQPGQTESNLVKPLEGAGVEGRGEGESKVGEPPASDFGAPGNGGSKMEDGKAEGGAWSGHA